MHNEDVRFDSNGCSIAGSFTGAADPVAAALVITGSGKLNRDSDALLPLGLSLRTRMTKAVADTLAAAGVSVLRYDKRGVGGSGGDYYRTGMSDQLADARAGLGWLADRAPGLPLLVVGHSEGTFYAAQLAADPRVAGIVLLSGPGQRGDRVLGWQTEMIAARLPRATRLMLKLTRTDIVRSQRKRIARIQATSADVIRIQGVRVNARWFRDFLAYDPAPALSQVTVPVLAITGGQDVQVQPSDIELIRGLVKGPYEGHVVGDLSHLLRPDPDSVGPRGYRRAVRQPVSHETLDLITAWVGTHWGERAIPAQPASDA